MNDTSRSYNPFEITKAVDFTDMEIENTWVDLQTQALSGLINPTAVMPHFIIGGKGGGRTHLMRHQSFSLQTIRAEGDLASAIQKDGYLGIYFRCGGLNSNRFKEKGQPADLWQTMFAYYMDVWLAQLALETFAKVVEDKQLTSESEIQRCARRIVDLFDERPSKYNDSYPKDLESTAALLHSIQRSMDLAVNNAALTRQIDLRILASPGRLVFGVPQVLTEEIRRFQHLKFVYLVDEFENLTEKQQEYVNTLVREKELPVNFIIGSRRYGVRTMRTLSAGEENRLGSEYSQTVLENAYSNADYDDFCRRMVLRRLQISSDSATNMAKVDTFFERVDSSSFYESLTCGWMKKYSEPMEYPYFVRLANDLAEHLAWSDREIARIVKILAEPPLPLLQKYALLGFYRGWASGKRLLDGAVAAGAVADAMAVADRTGDKSLLDSFDSYAPDLLAQLAKECKQQLGYSGFSDFVRMSGHLPRSLLVLLSNITRCANFRGERPFRSGEISLAAQWEGSRSASEWFFADAKAKGRIGEATERAMLNLGSFLRTIRFSPRIVEISPCTVSLDRIEVSRQALDCIDAAVNHSLLVEVMSGQLTKNGEGVQAKYQLNPMLAPKFELPIARRGTIALSATDVEAVFAPSSSGAQVSKAIRAYQSRLSPPFRNRSASSSNAIGQDTLPGLDLD